MKGGHPVININIILITVFNMTSSGLKNIGFQMEVFNQRSSRVHLPTLSKCLQSYKTINIALIMAISMASSGLNNIVFKIQVYVKQDDGVSILYPILPP